jgi:dihydropteroate synthase
LTIQVVDLYYQNVFKRYSEKYKIFRDLYEKDLIALEIRDLPKPLALSSKKIVLENQEICYTYELEDPKLVDLLALGSYGSLKEIAKEIVAGGNEDLGYSISKILNSSTEYENKSFSIDNNNYPLSKTYVMGIVNVTPDSFSDGGKYFETDAAVKHALELLDNGADIIDVGGESTRPGAEEVFEEEELKRVLPVIENILTKKKDTVISIDTRKSIIAEKAVEAGAKIINDISGATYDERIMDVAKSNNAGLILMHIKGIPENMQDAPFYEDVVSEVYDFLHQRAVLAKKKGIKNVFIDPGIGFGKRVFDNYELLKRLNEFKGIGCPIVAGLSRKSFLGKALNLKTNEREDATLIAETIAIKNGAKIIRTHDVKNTILARDIIKFVENPEEIVNV